MKRIIILVLMGMLQLGCSTTARMYPVEGPLFSANKLRPLQATVHGIMGNNGRIEVARDDGMRCEGEWSSAAGTTTTFSQGSLIGQYRSYVNVSTSSGGGQNPGQAIVICPDNNTYTIEFITGGGEATGFGVGKDRLGNVFRILF